MNIKDVKLGMKVKFIYSDIPEQIAEFYPLYKETGIVKAIDQESNNLVIQTKNDKKYMVCSYMVEQTNSDFDISDVTDEEIWDMLKAKMYKNGLTLESFYTMDGTKYIQFYKARDMYKAIGIAYRCGYERAKKGRSFKYNDKNIAKEINRFAIDKNGNKIYYNDDEVKIGDKVVFISHAGDNDKYGIWPEYGTVGTVVDYCNNTGVLVIWEDRKTNTHNWREYCKKVIGQ